MKGCYFGAAVLGVVGIMVIALIVGVTLFAAQTIISPVQVRQAPAVSEWYVCVYESPTSSCKTPVQMELVKIRMPNGSVKGYYFLLPVPPDFVRDDTKWAPVPIP